MGSHAAVRRSGTGDSDRDGGYRVPAPQSAGKTVQPGCGSPHFVDDARPRAAAGARGACDLQWRLHARGGPGGCRRVAARRLGTRRQGAGQPSRGWAPRASRIGAPVRSRATGVSAKRGPSRTAPVCGLLCRLARTLPILARRPAGCRGRSCAERRSGQPRQGSTILVRKPDHRRQRGSMAPGHERAGPQPPRSGVRQPRARRRIRALRGDPRGGPDLAWSLSPDSRRPGRKSYRHRGRNCPRPDPRPYASTRHRPRDFGDRGLLRR